MKHENGITLITLIVTIVVLMILTGVSINLALGDNGIIGIAKEQSNKYAQTVTNDQAELGELENMLKSEYVKPGNGGTGGNTEGGTGGETGGNTEEGNGGETEEPVVGAPTFTYTGEYEILNDYDGPYNEGNTNWRIRFLTSGIFTVNDLRGATDGIDIFLVGGGSGKSTTSSGWAGSGGGAGGYTNTVKGFMLEKNMSFNIVIGSGGTAGSNGTGGSGGSGGGASGYQSHNGVDESTHYNGGNGRK